MTAEIPTADDVSIGVDVTDAAQPSPEHIVGLGVGFWGSKVLLSAVELGVFTELAREPLRWRCWPTGWVCTRVAPRFLGCAGFPRNAPADE